MDAPSMILKSAHIRHYKSLDDVRVEFSHPITVIVGPNAVGKSNLVDCLRFVRDAVVDGMDQALGRRGGMPRVRQQSRTKPFDLSVDLYFLQPREGATPATAQYCVVLAAEPGANFRVKSESAFWDMLPSDSDNANTSIEAFSFNRFDRDAAGRIETPSDAVEGAARPEQIALGANVRSFLDSADMATPIAAFISQWRYSSIQPETLRVLESSQKDAPLSEDGANWASVVRALSRTRLGRETLARVGEAMQIVVPSYRSVTIKAAGRYLIPHFRFESGGHITEFDPAQLSDGTLRIFALLLALYQTPAPSLLLIEEPEQWVHPGVLGVLADAIREVSERTQIVVTTHSPHFVDQFQPHEIRVVTAVDGLTRIAPIRSAQVEAVKRRLMSLEEFMMAEGLQPEEG